MSFTGGAMKKPIIEKYVELNKVCKEYSARIQENKKSKSVNYAKDGFVEQFCLRK